MVTQLRGAGISAEVDPQGYPNGRFARFSDPEGNPIQGADEPLRRPGDPAGSRPTRRERRGQERGGGFLIEAEMEGASAKELNRTLLSALRKVEKRTTLRAEWTSGDTTERYDIYLTASELSPICNLWLLAIASVDCCVRVEHASQFHPTTSEERLSMKANIARKRTP
jgi:hypothetical protein